MRIDWPLCSSCWQAVPVYQGSLEREVVSRLKLVSLGLASGTTVGLPVAFCAPKKH
jgi:protein-disulfide isomerase-like protein with CxxC motif